MNNLSIKIFIAEIKRLFNIEKKYTISIISDFVVYYLLFMLLYVSVKTNLSNLPVEEINFKISIQVISYITWFFFSFTINFTSNMIASECSEGTMEQLFICNTSINNILIIRFIVMVLRNLILILPLTLILKLSTGCRILFSINTLIIFSIMIFGIFGLSLILGGMQLYYKNIGQIPFIITILFLGSAMFDVSSLPKFLQNSLYMLPFTKGVDIIKKSAVPNLVISNIDIILLTVNSVFYFILGILIFHRFIRKSMNSGRLATH